MTMEFKSWEVNPLRAVFEDAHGNSIVSSMACVKESYNQKMREKEAAGDRFTDEQPLIGLTLAQAKAALAYLKPR